MLGNFACTRYRFVLQVSTPLLLNRFAGSTLRGGFGHVFKGAVCIWPPGDCSRCLLKATCSYPYVFETAPPQGSQKLRCLDQVPRPFVIEPPDEAQRRFLPGERFDFRLVLIGRAIGYLPYFLFTFRALGQAGLGPGRGQFRVAELHAESPHASQLLYTDSTGTLLDNGQRVTASDLALSTALGARLTLRFLTPTRVRSEGTVQAEPSFQAIVRALLRRLSSLCYFHCGCELKLDFKGLIKQASLVRTVRCDLRWQEQERFSGRQHRRIEMDGVVGTVTYETPDGSWQAYWPLLAAGEWVHVGKGAVMGLGRYRAETVSAVTSLKGSDLR
jgi:hypothetical protein